MQFLFNYISNVHLSGAYVAIWRVRMWHLEISRLHALTRQMATLAPLSVLTLQDRP